jgi:hypothetical protein
MVRIARLSAIARRKSQPSGSVETAT